MLPRVVEISTLFFLGFLDALKIHHCAIFLISSRIILKKSFQCFLLNGILFAGEHINVVHKKFVSILRKRHFLSFCTESSTHSFCRKKYGPCWSIRMAFWNKFSSKNFFVLFALQVFFLRLFGSYQYIYFPSHVREFSFFFYFSPLFVFKIRFPLFFKKGLNQKVQKFLKDSKPLHGKKICFLSFLSGVILICTYSSLTFPENFTQNF